MKKRSRTDFIIVHHSATDRDNTTFDSIKNYHIQTNGWDNVGYHKVITSDGKIYNGMPEENEGYHCLHGGYNQNSLAVCLTGNFQTQTPTSKQLESLTKVLDEWRIKYNIPKDRVLGHKETGAQTACPGENLLPFLQSYRKDNMDFLKTDIPTEVEDKYKLKDIKRYNKHWTYDDLFKDWVKLCSEYEKLQESSKKEALELTERLSSCKVQLENHLKEKSVLESTVEGLKATTETQLKKLEELADFEERYKKLFAEFEELSKNYKNLEKEISENYEKQIEDLEKRLLTLQRPIPTVREALEILIKSIKKVFK